MSTDPTIPAAPPGDITAILAKHQRLPDLPEDSPSTWCFIIDGVRVPVGKHMVAFLDVPGRPPIGWSYGIVDDGNFAYDGWCFTEFGGGGVAMVPFAIIDGVLWVLTTMQFRYLVGRPIDGFVRGYKPPGVAAGSHAMVEFVEEFGTGATIVGKPFPLVGGPSYGATHIIDTRPLPGEPNPGGYQFGIQFNKNCFDLHESDWRKDRPRLRDGIFAPSDKLEALTQGRVLRWWEAAECPDSIISVGTLRLMATLRRDGIKFE